MPESSSMSLLSQIPAVDQILKQPGIQLLVQRYSRSFVLRLIDLFLQELRSEIKRGLLTDAKFRTRISRIEDRLSLIIRDRLSPSLRKVVNATGVIIFTNAGRTPMAPELVERLGEVATSYTNLEYDLERGTRGHRDQHIEERIKRILPCEAATVCNNAAAAVFLVLNTLAPGRKALVSRGELVEIGGSFRIPDIMAKSGAILEEVGTTNKTKAADYETSIDSETALILRVHQSNFRILGFTHSPSLDELVTISRKHDIPVVHDIGSGYLFPTQHSCLRNEPTVESSLVAGSDLIIFSGDKLLGGPQAGVILGRQRLVERVRKNPLMRTFRVDKLTSAALDWTLLQYEQGTYLESLPIWQLLSTNSDLLRARGLSFKENLATEIVKVTLCEGHSLTGGGSAPEEQIETWLLALTSTQYSPNRLERYFREFEVPILTRIEEDRVLLDLRTVFPDQDWILLKALNGLRESGIKRTND